MPQGFATLFLLQLACLTANAWVQTAPTASRRHVTLQAEGKSRREAVSAGLSAAVAAVVASTPAFADEEFEYPENPVFREKAGGMLEPFLDVTKGWRIMRPYAWNQFEQKPGEYETKWTDIVASNRQELVVVTSPVKSTTASISALGEVDAVASKLAAARNGQVVSAKAITKGGVLFYNFEFTVSDMHQVLELCVAKGKLWSVTASAPEKRWSKVGDLLNKSLLSFMPRL